MGPSRWARAKVPQSASVRAAAAVGGRVAGQEGLCPARGEVLTQLERAGVVLLQVPNHNPPFRFHRWLANLRVLEIEEIKSVPCAPVSHPFVERLIGRIRGEYLDRVFFWNSVDLARKLGEFGDYHNAVRLHGSLDGTTPAQRAGASAPPPASLVHHAWRQHCRALFQTPIAA